MLSQFHHLMLSNKHESMFNLDNTPVHLRSSPVRQASALKLSISVFKPSNQSPLWRNDQYTRHKYHYPSHEQQTTPKCQACSERSSLRPSVRTIPRYALQWCNGRHGENANIWRSETNVAFLHCWYVGKSGSKSGTRRNDGRKKSIIHGGNGRPKWNKG